MKKFLFLDFDNTMMATEQYAVPSLIARFNELYAAQLATPLTLEVFKQHFHGQARENLCANLESHFSINVSFADLYRDREWRMMQHLQDIGKSGGVPMAPHLVDVLAAVSANGVVLSFVSNNPVQRALAAMRYADNGQGDALAKLFGTRFFEAGDVQKPKPDVYIRAMQQVGASPETSAAVEDSVTGVTAAVSAGMTVYGFTGFADAPETAGDQLTAAGAKAVFADWQKFGDIYS
jgi:beta-phosphoglucomutase-like phosphatase (HAD superfamily)